MSWVRKANIKGPKGDTGPKGDKGETGATGAQGPKGDTGAQGPRGDKGDKGDAGAAGATPSITMSATVGNTVGTPSVQVTKGGTAAAPSFAFAFSNLKGATGAQGPKGDTGAAGAKGDTGARGPAGADGEDAVVATIPVTFEASLFASGVAARKSVAGLGSVNMISPDADAANVAVIQAAGPVLAQDHGDDSSIPERMVQLTVATAPSADMDFVITVLRSE